MSKKHKFDAVTQKRIDLCAHYRNWSFESILVDASLILAEHFKEKTVEIIRWATDVPMNTTSLLKEKGIALNSVDESALHHLTAAVTQYNQAKHRLIEVMTTYAAYQGEENNHGK